MSGLEAQETARGSHLISDGAIPEDGTPQHDGSAAGQCPLAGQALRQEATETSRPQSTLTMCDAAVAAGSCWVTGLELLAVQPACLRAHPDTPLAQQQQHLQHAQLGQHQELQHELLLHVAMSLTHKPSATEHARHAWTVTQGDQALAGQALAGQQQGTTATAVDPSPPLPLLLPHAELVVLTLNKGMQLLQQQRVNLLQLLLQQQRPQQQRPQVVLLQAATPAGFLHSDADSESSSKHETAAASSSSSSSGIYSWSVCLNLHISMPCLPTEQLLDCLHLLLMVSSNAGGTSAAAVQRAPAAAAAGLVAEVPLLVMPAPAQQEVQQLLLPAMRQEVQADQQQRQQQQHGQEQFGDIDFASQAMEVEQAAWRHFCQLAHDLYAVMQLSEAVEAEAAAAAAAAASAAAVLNRTAGTQGASTGTGAAPLVALVASSEAPSPAAAAAAPGPAAALAQLADTVLFPLMLPFLAAHGLHNTLALLLSCLPLPLQLQWRQQQLARLQELTNMGAPAVQPPVQEQQHGQPLAAQQQQQQQMGAHVQHAAPSDGVQAQEQQRQQVTHQVAVKQQEMSKPSTSKPSSKPSGKTLHAAAGAAGIISSSSKPARKAAADDDNDELSIEEQKANKPAAAAAAATAAAAAGVPWYLPLTQFPDGDMEQRYLAWKHHALLHLDYLAALFGVMYMVVMLKRMLSEPTTLFYFLYIVVKALPHVPLMLGMRNTFIRFDACPCGAPGCRASCATPPGYRELWLFLVAPVNMLLAWGMAYHHIRHGRAAMLLPNRAYTAYWSSRGELPTGILRPFFQHMRLRPYIVYTLWDAAISVWVFAQVFGVWAAIGRYAFAAGMSIGLCWGLDLYMRRRFVGRQLRGS